MKNVFVLAFGLMLLSEQGVFAKNVSKKSGKRAASTAKRSSSRRAAMVRRVSTASSVGMTGTEATSVVEEETDDIEKTKDDCIEAYNTCMEQKTVESLMMYDDLFNDYSDMISEIYNGMAQPTFRCLYSDDVIAIHTKYYYGSELNSSSVGKRRISKDSINYQTFLRTNAEQVANKKYSPLFLSSEVIKIAGLKNKPSIQQELELPDVSYKITTLDPARTYKENRDFCANPKENTSLAGCKKVSDDVINAWRNKSPKIEKSCDDYKVFLTEKKSKAEKETKELILGLNSRLTSVIDEYNAKIESDKALEQSELDKKNNEAIKTAQEVVAAAIENAEAKKIQEKKNCVGKKIGLGILTLGLSNLFIDC